MRNMIGFIIFYLIAVVQTKPARRAPRQTAPKRTAFIKKKRTVLPHEQVLDTEAAARGAEGIDQASRFELTQRIFALNKQNTLLREAYLLATQELVRMGMTSKKVENKTKHLPENFHQVSDTGLRELVLALVAENQAWQHEERKARAALNGIDDSVAEKSVPKFKTPPFNECQELKGESIYQPTRYDGRKIPQRSKWKVWLCSESIWLSKDLAYCEEGPQHKRKLSKNTEIDAIARQRGPDELYGSLHGQEATGLYWEHHGECMYQGHFELSIGGKYHLQLIHLRDNYNGLDEIKPLWAPLHFDFILGSSGKFIHISKTSENINESQVNCNTFDIAMQAKRISHGRFVFSGNGDPFSKLSTKENHVMPFRALDQRTFAWGNDLSPPMRVHYSNEISWLVYVNPVQYEWRPWTCRVSTVAANAQKCLRRYRFIMSGDSNMNALYKAVLGLSCNLSPQQLRKLKAPAICADDIDKIQKPQTHCENALNLCHSAGSCSNLWFARHTQHYGDLFPSTSFSKPNDILIANFGQWPAAKSHYTQSRYREVVDDWFSKLQGDNATRIWASTLPLVRNDAWVRATRDWRTLSRLQLYNEYADQVAERNGWLVFDEWNLTLPFLLAPREDIAHAAECQRQHHVPVLLSILCGGRGA